MERSVSIARGMPQGISSSSLVRGLPTPSPGPLSLDYPGHYFPCLPKLSWQSSEASYKEALQIFQLVKNLIMVWKNVAQLQVPTGSFEGSKDPRSLMPT
jgi:hypothetical protein